MRRSLSIGMVLYCIGIVLYGVMELHAAARPELDSKKTPFLNVQGIWERTGYGDIYVIGKDRATRYEYTRATCFQSDRLDQEDFHEQFIDLAVQNDGAGFAATSPHRPAFRRHFVRLESLPEVCNQKKRLSGFKPTKILAHVWHTFNDYYAFFKERNVDWQAQYAGFQDRVKDGMSGRVLFTHLSQLLAPIDDGHVYLESHSQEFGPEKRRGADVILRQGFKNQSKFDDYDDYVSWQMARYDNNLQTYLDDRSRQQAGGSHGNTLVWGTLNRRVGYLLVASMDSISTKRNASSLDNVKAVHGIMNRVMADLGHTEAMVIDVRFNGGGEDGVGLAIANRFTDKRRLAMTKTARSYRGDTPRREVYLIPEGDTPYLKPVVVIAGPDSASAAEVFVIAMRALPQVIQLGEATNGILSDELDKSLPRGWTFSLSNEVYYDHMGVTHEVKGVVPPTQVPVFTLTDLAHGRNTALEAALKVLSP